MDKPNSTTNHRQCSEHINRGYWFGSKPGNRNDSTVTVCPNNYCSFTFCEAANRYYQLSPVRMNQCSSHRSGTACACGRCEESHLIL